MKVSENQKFCHECGASLTGVTEPTQPVDGTLDGTVDGTLDEETLPKLSDLPTAEINPREPVPDPEWATPAVASAAPSAIVPADELTQADETDVSTTVTPAVATAAGAGGGGEAGEATGAHAITTQIATPDSGSTQEMPALFDGQHDLVEYAPAREPFKIKLIFILAILGAIATLMTFVADVTDIRTTRPAAGIGTGVSTIDNLGSNLAVGGFIGAVVMVLGGLLACYGFRWGAGIAGGSGLALVGWATLSIGLAEFPIAVAESITRTSSESFTLTVTRDLGWWLIAGVGVVGLIVFVASLRSFGTGNYVPINPWVAAVGAVSMVVLAAGPLVPIGAASFSDNFQSPTANIDLPTAYFAGRLVQVGLIALAGVVGFLLVRAYGLGAAAGSISVGIWLWVTSLAELGDNPVGIADRNPGSSDTVPHAVTSVGMGLSVALLIVAAVVATIQRRQIDKTY